MGGCFEVNGEEVGEIEDWLVVRSVPGCGKIPYRLIDLAIDHVVVGSWHVLFVYTGLYGRFHVWISMRTTLCTELMFTEGDGITLDFVV